MELASIFAIMGLGGAEIALIIFALLLLFGAKKIPELAKGLGRGIREFKDATKDVKSEIEKSLDDRPSTNPTSSYDASQNPNYDPTKQV